MAGTLRIVEAISPEAYLARERNSRSRHEYVDGVVYAMAGATDRHARISGNLFAALSNHLPDRCVPYMADMRLRVQRERAVSFYYPDTMVCCEPSDQSRDWREDPIVLGEVLSPATERTDRSEKLPAYFRIPTLEEVVLIEQVAAHVELYRRANGWDREVLAAGDTLRLASIDFAIDLDALYRRVAF